MPQFCFGMLTPLCLLFRADGEASVKVLLRAQEDWIPTQSLKEVEVDMTKVKIRTKGQREEASLDIGELSQSDWIKKYVTQLEEEEEEHEEIEKDELAAEVNGNMCCLKW